MENTDSSVDTFLGVRDFDVCGALSNAVRMRLMLSLTLLVFALLIGFCFWNISVFSGGFAIMSWWPLLIGALLAAGVFLLPQLKLPEEYVYYHRQLWIRCNSPTGLSRSNLQENSWGQGKTHWKGIMPSMANMKFWACVYLDTSLFWYFLYNPSSAASRFAPYFYCNAILSIISGVVLLFLLTNYILAIFPRGFSAWCFYIALMAWRICIGLFVFSYLAIAWGIYRPGQMTIKNTLHLLLGVLPETLITLYGYSEGTGWLAFVLMMTSFAWAVTIVAASLSIKRMLKD